MNVLHASVCSNICGGEVGATRIGDNYHYTGYRYGSPGNDCMVDSGGSLAAFLMCLYF